MIEVLAATVRHGRLLVGFHGAGCWARAMEYCRIHGLPTSEVR